MEIAELTNVKKKFGKKLALDSINIKIPRGKIVGLVGPNGAGKTTLMKIILGITPPDQGVVEVHGKTVKTHDHSMLENVGALIEYPDLYPFLTGYEHLKMYSKNNKFNGVIHQLEMESYIHKTSKNYSLGMKQKLGIAIALVKHPDFLILDEPMNGLDPIATRELRQLIKKLNQTGVTLLISSHVLSELEKIIDRMTLHKNGRVMLDESMDDLQRKLKKGYKVCVDQVRVATTILAKSNTNFDVEKNNIIFYPKDELEFNLILKKFFSMDLIVYDITAIQKDLENLVISEISD
ncbi:ABC transporter ATP-binding protein [Pediococcus acidilactici]|uniref:ABC transporter ATP-binding protein n=1 Tax=Pediococcus acidilactici TaxID=1254 RepID=UPI000464DEA2|nr:ATP-binding cassette domain-containing protein [Pediococcus acidilactici]KAF0494174.1 ATP-binding cassette domain-containing protein [Pediococcus acidilactici]MCF4060853.1 ATP-binding cassette domain-containing protein [Pediococcus acidilactici]MCJ2192826.1 ATP-binding cassette domain-containing protein [Pediococcus acidilactici]MWB53834.1 ATP-binding cassette domain-containing protein [Pediococcus acidilactici]QAR71533.1 ATP-binding cassette domain-containing protein [Pediococcus acidilact